MDNDSFIGHEIKRLREESGVSQIQLAKFLGVDQSLISRIEKNERQPSIEFIEKISILFGCPNEYFNNVNECVKPLKFAFRSTYINNDDMEAISAINRIALNLREMKSLL